MIASSTLALVAHLKLVATIVTTELRRTKARLRHQAAPGAKLNRSGTLFPFFFVSFHLRAFQCTVAPSLHQTHQDS